MFMIPFPFIFSEIVIFALAVQKWGFFDTLGLYFLPSLLGIFIVTVMGRLSITNLQTSLMRGEVPAAKLLSSGAIFLAGLLFIIPSFFSRVLAVILILPGFRHLVIWYFKRNMAKQFSRGENFGFRSSGFGFGNTGFGGFKYYEYRGPNSSQSNPFKNERDVSETNVLDVTPIKITHEESDQDDSEKQKK